VSMSDVARVRLLQSVDILIHLFGADEKCSLYNTRGEVILRCRWENMEMTFTEIGHGRGVCAGLAQDRDQWRVLVNTVINFRIPQNREVCCLDERLPASQGFCSMQLVIISRSQVSFQKWKLL
jgi:hypothetical protein